MQQKTPQEREIYDQMYAMLADQFSHQTGNNITINRMELADMLINKAKGLDLQGQRDKAESHEGVEEEAVKNGYMGEFSGYYKPVEEEKIFRAFLQLLNDEQFVLSTDSETGETVEFPDAVKDREAIIAISGEYDTESLKKAVCGFVRQFTSLNTKKHE